jgi:hypothetical protein
MAGVATRLVSLVLVAGLAAASRAQVAPSDREIALYRGVLAAAAGGDAGKVPEARIRTSATRTGARRCTWRLTVGTATSCACSPAPARS